MLKLLFSITFIFVAYLHTFADVPLIKRLQDLPGVVAVNQIQIDTTFTQQFEVYFKQPIDHTNPAYGYFNQRVIVSDIGFNHPMVAILEGYQIWDGSKEELTQIVNGNQINIEHRFFEDSKPDSIPWDKLTIWQAATDQHNIIKALQQIYTQPWVSTGISKGGQTTMYHRYYYPNDVAASVCYVAPLNLAREDSRIYHFLNTVGTQTDRQKIYDFQCLCFEKFEDLNKILKYKATEKAWNFDLGYEKTLQYSILEYSFAFWQWGGFTTQDIPSNEAPIEDIFNHLNAVSGFTFFEQAEVEKMRAFFWGALTEMGIYGYQTEAFKKYLPNSDVLTFDFTAPKGTTPIYDDKKMLEVKSFLDNDANNMLFIVGGLDTWGATAYTPSGKNNLVRMTLQDGHHETRINSFNEKERQYMYSLLADWLKIQINYPIKN